MLTTVWMQLLGMFSADYCIIQYRAKISRNPKGCFIWAVQTKTLSHGRAVSPAAAAVPEVRFRTTKSSWPKSTEHRQRTDSLAQAGLERSDSHILTDVHRRYAVQMSSF